jgi:hypothetical protein
MINVVCSVKDQAEKNSTVIVRSAQEQKDRDYFIDVVEIEVKGEICLVDVQDIIDAIEKCSSRRGRRGSYTRGYIPLRGNPNWEEESEE